jgi:hypothetical protein
LFKRAKDAKSKEEWLDCIVEMASFMLDDLNEIDRWLTGKTEREELFKRFKSDLTPLSESTEIR